MKCHYEYFLWSREDIRNSARACCVEPFDLLDSRFELGPSDCIGFALRDSSLCPHLNKQTHMCTAGSAMPLYCRSRLRQSLYEEDVLL